MDRAIRRFYLRRKLRLDGRGVKYDEDDTRFDYSNRLAYGLCKEYGIDTKGMSPKEAWQALREKTGKSSSQLTREKKAREKSPNEIKRGHGEYLTAKVASKLKEIGGYRRKNNFKNGYGVAVCGNAERNDMENGQSMNKNTDKNGNWNSERLALHSKIIDETFEGKKKADGKPVTMFLGGGPASGKTFVKNKFGDKFGATSDETTISVDPDAVKAGIKYEDGSRGTGLPEYDEKKPSFVHEESSAVAKQITQLAQENGYNTLVDGTGDGSVGSMKKKIAQAKANGNVVKGRYVFMPVEDAIMLNAKRDRSVRADMLINTHKKITSILPEIAADFDDCELYANVLGGEPKLIARGGGGKGLEILDKDLYDKFLANGSYQYDEKRVRELEEKGRRM